jgi:hypothetical protein
VESFATKIEPDIEQPYTYPVRLQNRKHYSVERFEICPTDGDCDAILPFWWIAKHAPSNLLGRPEDVRFVHFKNYTQLNASEFSLDIDLEILKHPEARVIGSIATEENNTDPIKLVPQKFRKWVHIITKEAAQKLPEHKP